MRSALLRDREGSVLWGDSAFWFAVEDNRIYGGKLVCAEGPSYAVCRREQPDVCEITEFMSAPEHLPALFAALLQEMPAQDYRIRFRREAAFCSGGRALPFGPGTRLLRDAPAVGRRLLGANSCWGSKAVSWLRKRLKIIRKERSVTQ